MMGWGYKDTHENDEFSHNYATNDHEILVFFFDCSDVKSHIHMHNLNIFGQEVYVGLFKQSIMIEN